MSRTAKICEHCGRPIAPRRMRDADWDTLRYCSSACRRSSGARVHTRLEDAIRSLLASRDAGSSICPSEAVRAVFGERFRDHMEDGRAAARRLARRGIVVVTQRGRPVPPESIRGPVRLARGPRFAPSDDAAPSSSVSSARRATS